MTYSHTAIRRIAAVLTTALFAWLSIAYVASPGRRHTARRLQATGPHTSTDYMLSSLNVTSIAEGRNGLMWIGTSAGLNVFDGQSYVQYYHDTRDTTALPDDYINCLHRDRRGRMWVGTQNGLAVYAGGRRFSRVALPGRNANVIGIGDDGGSGNVLVATMRGQQTQCFRVGADGTVAATAKQPPRPQAVPIPGAPQSLRKPQQLVSCVTRDAGGNTWVGFRNAGYQVVSARQAAFKRANANRLAGMTRGKDIIALARVGSNLLAGTTLRLYAYDCNGGNLSQTFYNELFDSVPGARRELVAMAALDSTRAWLMGSRQVVSCRIAGGKVTAAGRSFGSPGGAARLGSGTVAGGRLYVSCDDGRLLAFGFGGGLADSVTVDSRWFDDETQLTTLHDGRLLLFMRNMHLAVYSPATRRLSVLGVTGAPTDGNTDPAFAREDSYGTLWLGTKRSGLYRLDLPARRLVRTGFLNDVHVQAIAEDRHRQLWVTTLRDAVCYQPRTGAAVMNSLLSSSQNEWSRQFFDNSLCTAPDGSMVFGSSDGCLFLSALTADGNRAADQRLRVSSVSVRKSDGTCLELNEDVGDGSDITLAHDENTLTFGFFYPNFGGGPALRYQWRLDGYDHDWHVPSYAHAAHYDNLPPGHYTLRLRLLSSTSLPPVSVLSISVDVMPAWWVSPAAWLFYIVCACALICYVNKLYLRLRTNRLRLAHEQREREREQRTNEMNMNFFANIAHEFRNPLTIIAGPLMSLRSDHSLPAKAQLTLNRVCMSVNRMLRLIDQMLDFNQLEADALRLQVARADVAQLLAGMAATFEESARVRGISLVTDTDANGSGQWIDADKFEKIVSNLYTNALKHTPSGGTIRLSAHAGPDGLRLKVWNSGSHIDDGRLDDVFKRYYQLADNGHGNHYGWGTGIGLYYVRRLVTLHHGTISAANTDGGVEFSCLLPTADDAYTAAERAGSHDCKRAMLLPVSVAAGAEASQPQPAPEKGAARILVVDDDVAGYIRSVFSADYMVTNRFSAEEALADIDQTAPDIILSDVVMGGMSGFEMCRRLKADIMHSHIPVVMITAKNDMSEQVSGLRLGAVAYVTKPFDPSYLRAVIESQLRAVQTMRRRLGESVSTDEAGDVAATLSEPDRQFMAELYKLMERRSAEQELNVSTVSHDLLISPSKFNYKLKELTGDTPGTFFRKYKLNRAARLLREGSHNVSEVAVMTGFATAAHFSVAFKKQFGIVPSEYCTRPGR